MSGVSLEVKWGEGEPRRGYSPESALRGTEAAPLASLGIAEDAGQNCLLGRKGRGVCSSVLPLAEGWPPGAESPAGAWGLVRN